MFAFFGYAPRTTKIFHADEFTIGWGGTYRVCLHVMWGRARPFDITFDTWRA